MNRRHRFLDLLLALWVVGWLLLAWQVASEVRGLRDLSETVTKTGVAVRESGEALATLSDVPLVGDQVSGPAERIQQAGQSAVESARSTRDSIDTLSVLLAIAIGGIPPVAVLGIYLQLRREQALARQSDEPRQPAG